MAIINKPLNPFEIADLLGYVEYRPHPVTGVSVRCVDWAKLCTHENINKWSRYKPMTYPTVEQLTEAQIDECWGGFYSSTKNSELPRGGLVAPYRITDFEKYNHNAYPPVYVDIISVNEHTTPPFNLMKGSTATIVFKLRPGFVDPQLINAQTIRTKLTGADAGYGGLSWVGEGRSPMLEPITRTPSEVFGTELLEVEFTQTVFLQVVPRMEFMYWRGSAQNKYDNRLNMEIYDPNYQGLFTLSTIGEDIGFSALPLFWNQIEQRVQARTRTNNNYSRITYVRLSVRYTINVDMPIPGENQDRFASTDTFTLEVGQSTQIVNLHHITVDRTYSYKVYYYLERLIGSTWDIISETMLVQDLYIPPAI